jgi:CheY-like chemotaxis protein
MLGLAIERTLAAEHEVTVVASAQEASRLLSGGAKFELILCDLMMPEMTGMDLYAEVLGRITDQAEKFVFMTGGAFSENAARFLAQRSSPSIEKPFKAPKLRDFV